MKVGILGAGSIAVLMAKTLRGMEVAEPYAVASRDLEKAKQFAAQNGIGKAYGSYEEMLSDPEIELVYVATPHSHHFVHTKLCLEYGKNVLCEKAFMVNTAQTKEILALANSKKLLLTEAIWTRYMPFRKTIENLLAEGVIGQPQMLTANLGYLIAHIERNYSPALAGGALLDLGVYALNFASMFFGNSISSITGNAVFFDTGVDAQNSMTLSYEDGRMAVLCSSFKGLSDRRGIIYGDDGFLEVQNINNFEMVDIYNRDRKHIAHYDAPQQITGYEYEVEAAVRAIQAGEYECFEMPHQETILMMEWMDELRRQWGIKYPCE
jgi:predicted dehydrogenase